MSYLKAQPSVDSIEIYSNRPLKAKAQISLNGAIKIGFPFVIAEKGKDYEIYSMGDEVITRQYLRDSIKVVMIKALLEQSKVSAKRALHLSEKLLKMNE